MMQKKHQPHYYIVQAKSLLGLVMRRMIFDLSTDLNQHVPVFDLVYFDIDFHGSILIRELIHELIHCQTTGH